MEIIETENCKYLIDFDIKIVFYNNINRPYYGFTIYNDHVLLTNPDRTRELQNDKVKNIILTAYGNYIMKKLLE